MNKQLTYITIYFDEHDEAVDFERWTCQKIATVYKNTKQLFSTELYRTVNKDVKTIKCYDYFDGIKGLKPAAVWNIVEVLP